MSLFIGGLAPSVRQKDLQDTFAKHGHITRCDLKGSFGFITFEDERDAEDAIEAHNNKIFFDQKINVEWAKGSGRYDPRSDRPRGRDRGDDRCYECGERGHRSYDCRNSNRRGGGGRGGYRGGNYRSNYRRSSRSRSRSPRRDRRERDRSSRSPRRDRDSRDDSRDDRRDRGDRKDRDDKKDRERSRDRGDRDDDKGSRGRDAKDPSNGNDAPAPSDD